MGLRKFKSEKDLKGKLRKTRASEEGSRAASQHHRVPSVPPVLPLPSHLTQSTFTTSPGGSSSGSSHINAALIVSGTTGRSMRRSPNTASHRRSRSFSMLTSMLSPSTSMTLDQPWRSREAWLAIHARTPSPPPTSTLPSAPGCIDGGWRRKGNGGFFARELAGVGESALTVNMPPRPGLGVGRSRTMGDLATELDRPAPTRQSSDPTVEHLSAAADDAQAIQWRPGFATSLYRQKTKRISLINPATPPAEEIVTPPAPFPPSRPESRVLPDPTPPPAYKRSGCRTSASANVRAGADITRGVSTRTTGTDSTCSVSPSIRTSQSSSIHTYEIDEQYELVIQGRDSQSSSAEMVHSFLVKAPHLRPHPADVPESPDASPLPPRVERLPTIVTPTSTYYHFGSVHSINGRPVSTTSSRKGEKGRTPAYLPYVDEGSYSGKGQDNHERGSQHICHNRDESLPPLLPPAPIERYKPTPADPNSPKMGRMTNLPWAQAQSRPSSTVAATVDESQRSLAGIGPATSVKNRRSLRSLPISKKEVGKLGQVEEDKIPPVPALPSPRTWEQGEAGARWSRGSSVGKRGSEGRRGGWI